MSTLKADTIVASDGTSPVTLTKQSAAKAWVNFNGTGTIAILDSTNTSSLTDNATGDYSANYASNMTDTKSVKTFSADINNATGYARIGTMHGPASASFARCATHLSTSTSKVDCARVHMVTHGDLA